MKVEMLVMMLAVGKAPLRAVERVERLAES
jgi:hypothetical protein